MDHGGNPDTMTATAIIPGDVWMLRWDGKDLAAAMIARVYDDFVVVWPVTNATREHYAPALLIDQEHRDLGDAVWPTRPTGIGNHLLGRRLGALLDRDAVETLTDQMEDPEVEPTILPLAEGTYDSEADDRLIDEWNAYCFHTGVPTGRHWLHTGYFTSSRQVAEALGLDVVSTRDYWDGVIPLSDEQLATLARAIGRPAEDLTGCDPYAHAVRRLSSPDFKASVEAQADATGMSEERVRDETRREFALAARDDSANRMDDKLRDALFRIEGP